MFDVTVLMFTYRKQRTKRNNWIKLAINSVREQEGVRVQFIILDDGSVNRLKPITVKDTKNVKIEYKYFKKNRGKRVMMLMGLKMLKGRTMTTLHDDDYFPTPTSLKDRLKCFDATPRNILIWTDAYYRRGSMMMKRSKLKGICRTTVHNHYKLIKRNYICGASYLMDSKLSKKFLWDPRLKHGEEYDLWKKISLYAKKNKMNIRYCPKITAVYRLHTEQNFEELRRRNRRTIKRSGRAYFKQGKA